MNRHRLYTTILAAACVFVIDKSLEPVWSSSRLPEHHRQPDESGAQISGERNAQIVEAPKARTLGHDGPVRGFAFTPDSSRLAVMTDDGGVLMWNVVTGDRVEPSLRRGEGKESRRAKFRSFLPSFHFTFSADGKHLIWISGGRVAVWDTATRQVVLLRDDLEAAAASPDGSILALGTREGVVLWDLASRRTRDNPIPGDLGEFSPDGRLLVVSRRAALLLVGVAERDVRAVPFAKAEEACFWLFSPDSRILAIKSKNTHKKWTMPLGWRDPYEGDEVGLWDVSGAEVSLLATLSGSSRPAFSPDTRLVAMISPGHSRVGDIVIWDLTTKKSFPQLTEPSPQLIEVPRTRSVDYFFGPGASLLALTYPKELTKSETSNTLELWEVGGLAPRMIDRIAGALQVAFRRDGTMLAYKETGQGIGLWSVELGKTVAVLPGKCPMGEPFRPQMDHLGLRTYPSFSFDGSWFACGGWPTPGAVTLWDLRTLDCRSPNFR